MLFKFFLYLLAWRPGKDDTGHKWEDIPSEPLPDDPNLSSPKYDPPPMDCMETFIGYENTSYGEGNDL